MVCSRITYLPCAVSHPALWFVAGLPLFPALLATLHCGLLHYYISSMHNWLTCIVVCCIITSLPCTVGYPALWFVALLHLFHAQLATMHCGLLLDYLSSLCCYPPCIVVCSLITSLPCAVNHPAFSLHQLPCNATFFLVALQRTGFLGQAPRTGFSPLLWHSLPAH